MENNLKIGSDIIDVRDIIGRVEALEDELLAVFNEQQVIEGDDTETDDPLDGAFREWCKATVHEDAAEYLALCEILDDLCGNGGDEQWRGKWFPVTLISEDYFTEYAKDLVQAIGDLPRDIPSYLEIDWDATAENIKVDYSTVEIDGDTYYYR